MVRERLKQFGSDFTFEFFLEMWKPKIITVLREWLESYTPEQVRTMVSQGKFPDAHSVNFNAASDYLEHIEVISAEELFKDFLIPARPDLAVILLDIPADRGVKWFENLRLHLLDQLKHPEKELAKSTEYEPKGTMKRATCDKCGKSWPIPEAEASSIDKCPFCGQ